MPAKWYDVPFIHKVYAVRYVQYIIGSFNTPQTTNYCYGENTWVLSTVLYCLSSCPPGVLVLWCSGALFFFAVCLSRGWVYIPTQPLNRVSYLYWGTEEKQWVQSFTCAVYSPTCKQHLFNFVGRSESRRTWVKNSETPHRNTYSKQRRRRFSRVEIITIQPPALIVRLYFTAIDSQQKKSKKITPIQDLGPSMALVAYTTTYICNFDLGNSSFGPGLL